MKRTFSHTFVTITICTLIGFSAFTQAQKSDDNSIRNPKPTELWLLPMNKGEAVVAARFPHQKPGTEIAIVLGDEHVVLNDRGENGDEKPRDGIFSTATKFDSEQFVEANRIFAKVNLERKRTLFTPGGRESIGVQTVAVKGEHMIIEQHLAEKPRQFVLPLSLDAIEFRRPIELPVLGPELGLPFKPARATSVDASESLMITRLDVVNDPDRTWFCESTNQPPNGNPMGEWTFWQLMAQINNGQTSTSDFIKQMFDHWNSNQLINNHIVNARPHVYQEIIEQWEIRSGGSGAALQPEHSPFKLLGIVLRADLRGPSSVYGGGDAGEGRFVFSLHDGNCNSMGKTLILEYQVPINSCQATKEWAQAWIDLDGSSNYNSDLASLTEVFASADAAPSSPNGSAISQVRTNEFLPLSPLWEMREFRLPDGGGLLQQTTVKQEPQMAHNNTAVLADYVNLNWIELINHTHTIPDNFAGHNDFLAGSAPTPQLWNAPASALNVPANPPPSTPGASNEDEALQGLAVNTCSGCHQIETGTNFAHLHYNTQPGQEAILSGFLTGITLPDPRNGAIMREFNDLERREEDLLDAASQACPSIGVLPGNVLVHELTRAPVLNAVH